MSGQNDVTDVKLAQLEERQMFQQRELDSIKPIMKNLASSMTRMADDMHIFATIEFRVTSLEKSRDAAEARDTTVQNQLAKLHTADAVAGVKLGNSERLFWILVTALVAALTAALTAGIH